MQGGFQLRVSVYDSDSDADDLVDQIFAERDLEVNQSYTTVSSYTGTYGQGTMELSFKVECAQFYYGLDCTTFCEPMDNSSGHYSCDDNGNKVCLDGWVDVSTDCLTRMSVVQCLPYFVAFVSSTLLYNYELFNSFPPNDTI